MGGSGCTGTDRRDRTEGISGSWDTSKWIVALILPTQLCGVESCNHPLDLTLDAEVWVPPFRYLIAGTAIRPA